ncbi:MAG: prolipoprotein diacylglyceryl transferase [Desulfatitalea sp.]|nr:prolipoprotein diacylglyceryl transferase [Desulfatitalea sp.]NNK02588.1 prolipoprotein diacylglyceryl transferase [Desulfatitalea sp.]
MSAFWRWWQHIPEHLDPVIFQIGSFRLQYYGMMYLVAFSITYFVARYRIKTENRWSFTQEHLQGLLTAMIIGLILGARLGYVIFYNLTYFLDHPLEIILPFNFKNGLHFTGISGMSYHGGLIGAFIGLCWYSHKYKLGILDAADLLAPGGALGYTFGRLGNFINGELWGRITTAPIGMHFPNAEGNALRHPSQLYEAFAEGILLFILLWPLRHRLTASGGIFGLYLISYGTARFIIEFFRQPDAHLGFIFLSFSMGQMLCGTMILAGIGFYIYGRKSTAKGVGKK